MAYQLEKNELCLLGKGTIFNNPGNKEENQWLTEIWQSEAQG